MHKLHRQPIVQSSNKTICSTCSTGHILSLPNQLTVTRLYHLQYYRSQHGCYTLINVYNCNMNSILQPDVQNIVLDTMVHGPWYCIWLILVHHLCVFLGTSGIVARMSFSLKLGYRWGSMGQAHSEALWVKP